MKDSQNLGDRTLAAFYCADLHFSTYTIGNLDDGSKPNLTSKIAIGEYESLWTYIYMAYSDKAREVGIFVKYPDLQVSFKFKDVQHFVPNYLGVYVFSDDLQPSWSGFGKRLQFSLGEYANVEAKEIIDLVPHFFAHKHELEIEWK